MREFGALMGGAHLWLPLGSANESARLLTEFSHGGFAYGIEKDFCFEKWTFSRQNGVSNDKNYMNGILSFEMLF